jgi:adenine-specific DNA glycosylase
LYDFPSLEHTASLNETELLQHLRKQFLLPGEIHIAHRSGEIRHRLSHQLLHIHFNIIEGLPDSIDKSWIQVRFEQLTDFPFPEIINKYKTKNNLFKLKDIK